MYLSPMDWIVTLPDRLDAFLAAEGRMLSRAKAQAAIEDGRVTVNDGVATKAAFRLQEGDHVRLTDKEARASGIEPADMGLTVLYEDSACLVLNKPAGIAVHPGAGMAPGEKTLLHGVAFLFRERSLPFSEDSVLVHRLDRETTGCILVAKDPASHLFLQKQFETRTVVKTYLALVAGVPELPIATIDAPIGRSMADRTKMGVMKTGKTREAQTTYRTLATVEHMALLACTLHTGRTHQVRVHLQSIGYPIIGDGTYTSTLSERLADDYDIHDLCLHAWKLTFLSPADRKDHAVTAPLPLSFTQTLKKVGIETGVLVY